MEPQSPQAHPSPEMGVNRAQEVPRVGGESHLLTPEKPQVSREATLAPQAAPTSPPVATIQMPTLPAPAAQPVIQAPPTPAGGPVTASDEDVIEKEWVDKAKRIVNQTKDDPYAQEKEVSKLQADYLKKRYGKELKLSSE